MALPTEIRIIYIHKNMVDQLAAALTARALMSMAASDATSSPAASDRRLPTLAIVARHHCHRTAETNQRASAATNKRQRNEGRGNQRAEAQRASVSNERQR